MAELLVRAAPHWKDSFTQDQIDALQGEELDEYNARTQIGDVVCVYEDGVCTEDPSPNSKFILIKIPGVTLAQAKQYVRRVSKVENKKRILLKRRKFRIPENWVKNKVDQGKRTVVVSKQQAKQALINSIEEKNG